MPKRRGAGAQTPGSSKKGSIAHYLQAQRIAFAPLMFQAARVARDNGLLQAVEDAGPEGLTPEEAAKKAGSSRYGARVLLEGCLALQLVLLRGGRYVIDRAGRLVLHDEMTRVNMDFTHDVCYRGAFFLEQSIAEGRPVGLGVFGDGNKLTMDPANGWSFKDMTMTTIVLNGSLCDQVLSGTIHDVTVAFVCVVE